jgi:hypothetical protein
MWLLVAALVFKLAGGLVREYLAFEVYEDSDAQAYHRAGVELAEGLRAGGLDAVPDSLTRSNFVRFATGLVYAVIGPSKVAAFLIFSWLGFWGLFYFYRAFRLAVPEGRHRTYARLLFFLPSILYWPSSIGKESFLMFGLGLAAFGVASILTGSMGRGVVLTAMGVWVPATIRAYLAAFVAVGLVVAYVARRSARPSPLAPVVKLITLAGLSVVVVLLIRNSEEALRLSDVDASRGVASVSREVTSRTEQGGSEFTPHPVVQSPAEAPLAAFTVLFRPMVTEAHNPQAVAAALEGSFLLLLTVMRLPWILSALGSLRRQPYVAYAAVYVAISIAAMSVIANFGILARQRTLLLPLYLVFLSVPPRARRIEDRADTEVATMETAAAA